MKKIFSILIIIVIIILSLWAIKNKDIINERLPLRILIIKSNSMYPKLEKGDIVLIKKYNNYIKGDIITYSFEDNYLVTHRIIEKNNEGFITKGDNNNSEDNELIKLENIKGKVILKINKNYRILIVLVFIILVFFVFFKCNKEA